MKTLYLECNMGAAGDMLMGALLELHPDSDAFLQKLNSVGIPKVLIKKKKGMSGGISGTYITVLIDGEEEICEDTHVHVSDEGQLPSPTGHPKEHSSMLSLEHIIACLQVSDFVKIQAVAVYRLLAEAESYAHGLPVDKIHFHELGAMDAVADIVGVCMLIEELSPRKICASPVHVGSGQVHCAHGILPVPAPATAFVLRGVPIYGGEVRGELCTPTGAALLKHFVNDFGAMPLMKLSAVGYGMGKKNFGAVNCVRAMLGEAPEAEDEVAELVCNIDDMTPETLTFAMETLLHSGLLLDIYSMPINMKKGRSGVLLVCLCRRENTTEVVRLMFRHTTTLGIREKTGRRYILNRVEKTLETKYGPVRVKYVKGYDVYRYKFEYEDMARIARERDIPLPDLYRELESLKHGF